MIKKKQIILIGVLVIFFILFTWLTKLLGKNPILQITSIEPTSNQTEVEFYQPIRIGFNNKSSYFNLISLISEPKVEFEQKIEEGKVVFVPKTAYQASKTYQISVWQKGIETPLLQFAFTTQSSPSNLGVVEKIEDLNQRYYPLLEYLPPESNNFKAYYIDRLVLKVQIYSKGAEAVKKEVNEWIISKNIDPSTHQFVWVEMLK